MSKGLVSGIQGMATNGRKPKDTEVLTAIDDRKIATLRLLLATSVLLIISLEPWEPDRHVWLTNLCLVFYTVYSAVIYAVTLWRRSFSWRVFVGLKAADLALFTVLISLSTGTNSLFFFSYPFAVLIGAMREGRAFGFGLTIISAVLFTVFSYISAPGGVQKLSPFLLRPLGLLVFGYIIAYWAGAEFQLKRRLALLKEMSLTANPRFDVGRIIGGFMERLLVFYNRDGCVLALADPQGPSYRLHRATRQYPAAGGDSVEIQTENECPLLDLARQGAGVYRERDSMFRNRSIYRRCDLKSAQTTKWTLETDSHIAEWLDARSFITAPICYRDKNLGAICLTSTRPAAFDLDDAIYLQQIVDQVIPVLENVRLVDRLAAEAANEERRKIARSIHDRVIQPYLGLQMGLDAVQQLTKEGVEELRDYVYGLRRPNERQLNLIDSIRRFACQFADVTGIEVHIVNRLTHVFIGDRLAAEVFQMVTEALSNVRRHTKANHVVVHLETVKDMLIIRCDNDRSDENSQRGFHPVSIADRAEALGGRTFIRSEDGYTKVQVELPL